MAFRRKGQFGSGTLCKVGPPFVRGVTGDIELGRIEDYQGLSKDTCPPALDNIQELDSPMPNGQSLFLLKCKSLNVLLSIDYGISESYRPLKHTLCMEVPVRS
jgi:hypothetical protein